MPNASQPVLLLWAVLAILGLILLIARFKVHAFIALILASLMIGVCGGMSLSRIALTFQEGLGTMLGSIASVVGLGMILGKLLTESGGAEVVAHTLIQLLGERRLAWALLFIGFLVGIPVFFTVGVVLLVPILMTLLRDTKLPLLSLGIPLVAGLSVVHGLVPPHPGPMAAIGVTQADAGRVILYSLLVGLPTALLVGPLFGSIISRRISVAVQPSAGFQIGESKRTSLPTFGLTIVTMLLPVILMLMSTLANLTLPKGNPLREVLEFIGSPLLAMLVATLVAFGTFGFARGFTQKQILKFTEDCLGPAASILLVVGAGGGFNRVLVVAGVGDALAAMAKSVHFSPILLGWLVAAAIRVATGSATVAITAAAGIVTPIAKSTPNLSLEWLVVSMGAGSLILSHVNDGGFWFVKEYFGLNVEQTLKSWTVLETLISVVALFFVLLLNRFI